MSSFAGAHASLGPASLRGRSAALPEGVAQLSELRRRVGMATQDVQLFHATVRENLTFFDPSIPDERILAVLEQLELLPWYQSLTNGLDTVLAGSGGLSAGVALPPPPPSSSRPA